MRFARAVSLTLLTKGLALICGVITSVIIARTLGPSGRGVLTVLMAILAASVQFGSFGLNGSVLFFTSREPHRFGEISGTIILAALGLGAITSAVLSIAANLTPGILLGSMNVSLLYLILPAVPFAILFQFSQSALIARHEVSEYNSLELAARIMQLAGMAVVLVVFSLGTNGAVACFVIATILAGGLSMIRLARQGPIRFAFDRPLLIRMLRYGLRASAGGILLFLTTRVNVFLINHQLGEHAVGLFSVPMQFLDLVSLVPLTLGMLLFPRVASNEHDRGHFTARVFRTAFFMLIAVCLMIVAVGPSIIPILFGEDFLGSIPPLLWITPGILFFSLWTILNNDLAARGIPTVMIAAPFVGLAVNVMCTAFLLEDHGITGAAFSLSLSSFIGLFIVARYFQKVQGISALSMFWLTVEDIRTIYNRSSP